MFQCCQVDDNQLGLHKRNDKLFSIEKEEKQLGHRDPDVALALLQQHGLKMDGRTPKEWPPPNSSLLVGVDLDGEERGPKAGVNPRCFYNLRRPSTCHSSEFFKQGDGNEEGVAPSQRRPRNNKTHRQVAN